MDVAVGRIELWIYFFPSGYDNGSCSVQPQSCPSCEASKTESGLWVGSDNEAIPPARRSSGFSLERRIFLSRRLMFHSLHRIQCVIYLRNRDLCGKCPRSGRSSGAHMRTHCEVIAGRFVVPCLTSVYISPSLFPATTFCLNCAP